MRTGVTGDWFQKRKPGGRLRIRLLLKSLDVLQIRRMNCMLTCCWRASTERNMKYECEANSQGKSKELKWKSSKIWDYCNCLSFPLNILTYIPPLQIPTPTFCLLSVFLRGQRLVLKTCQRLWGSEKSCSCDCVGQMKIFNRWTTMISWCKLHIYRNVKKEKDARSPFTRWDSSLTACSLSVGCP